MHACADLFQERVKAFKTWLLERPETVIGVVAHWGLLHELTGGDNFGNCELRSYHLDPSGRVQDLSIITKAASVAG
jgi:hypothetical protein